jgi:predicted DNA-binding transcriptional regulator
MVSKDQAIGGVILVVCAVVAVIYTAILVYPKWLTIFGFTEDAAGAAAARFWLIAIPVFVAFVAIMAIGAWIGWTMATTPPPKPIEEITTEMEEKPEEMKPETTEAPKPEDTTTSAEKKKKM